MILNQILIFIAYPILKIFFQMALKISLTKTPSQNITKGIKLSTENKVIRFSK